MSETNANVTQRNDLRNPWNRENRAEYRMGALEKLLHDNLGLRTGYDKYMEEMDNNASAWETENQSAGYEENYNSAEEQAQRLREAGINPDLNQSNIKPGEATEMTEKDVYPESPLGEDMNTIDGIAKFGFQLVDTLIGGFSLKNAFKMTDIARETLDYTRDIEEDKFISNSVKEALATYGSDEEYENGGYVAKMKGLTGKRYEKFSRLYDQLYGKLPHIIEKANKDTEAKTALRNNKLIDAVFDVKDEQAKAELKIAQIETETAEREAKFLEEHPDYNKAELEAGILQHEADEASANALFAKWRKIRAEADGKIAQTYSTAIRVWEAKLELAGLISEKYGGVPGHIIKYGIENKRRRKAERYYGSKDKFEFGTETEYRTKDGKFKLNVHKD